MPSWQSYIVSPVLGWIQRTAFKTSYSPRTMRKIFDGLRGLSSATLMRRYPKLKIQPLRLGTIDAEIFSQTTTPEKTVLYLHGGGYFMGSIKAYRRHAAKLASLAKIQVVLIEYRLAPEYPYPAALDDALTAYLNLMKLFPQIPMIIGGDSAGGGLTLATLLKLHNERLPLPAAAFCFSPWTDLSGTIAPNRKSKDVWLSQKHIEVWAPMYSGVTDPKHPYVSPVYGDYHGLPPLLIFVGSDELILSDSLRVAEQAATVGVSVQLFIGKGMQHIWPIVVPFLPESKQALQSLRDFIDKY